jgi:hypothetical protein
MYINGRRTYAALGKCTIEIQDYYQRVAAEKVMKLRSDLQKVTIRGNVPLKNLYFYSLLRREFTLSSM